jgi:hypothetical protein
MADYNAQACLRDMRRKLQSAMQLIQDQRRKDWRYGKIILHVLYT